MREILFRGKTVNGGEWVQGSLFAEGTRFEIIRGTCNNVGIEGVKVIPETIGQFTGMFDKNGTKIFEGDILKTREYETYTEKLKGYYGYDKEGYPQKVPGYTGSMCVTRQKINDDYRSVVRYDKRRGFYIEGASVCVDAICNSVIGNIHDNPELLRTPKNDEVRE